jgi:hypothetical protein
MAFAQFFIKSLNHFCISLLLLLYTPETLIEFCALLHTRLAAVLGFTGPFLALLDPSVLLFVPDFLVLLSQLDAVIVGLGNTLVPVTPTRR